MKRQLLTALVCALLFNSYGQKDSIVISMSGTNQVTIKSNNNRNVIYNRTLKWINKAYKNPEKVISGNQENESVTVSGFQPNATYMMMLGSYNAYDLSYHIYFTFSDSSVNFNLVVDKVNLSKNSTGGNFYCSSFFKKDGTPRESYQDMRKQLEKSLNEILKSYMAEINSASFSSDEALQELKRAKDKLELGLIDQANYDALKNELSKYIK